MQREWRIFRAAVGGEVREYRSLHAACVALDRAYPGLASGLYKLTDQGEGVLWVEQPAEPAEAERGAAAAAPRECERWLEGRRAARAGAL